MVFWFREKYVNIAYNKRAIATNFYNYKPEYNIAT